MKKKKLLSILLALVMVATLLPATAFAAESESGNEDGWHYVTMNVPYADFYEAYGVDDAAYYKLPNDVDGVSTATTGKSFGPTGGATYNDGVAYILGVKLPVQISDTDYANLDPALKDAANKNYGYTDLETAPAYYSTLTIGEDGKYEFSQIAKATVTTDYLSIEPDYAAGESLYDGSSNYHDKKYNDSSDGFLTSGYGDYQIAIGGYSTTEGIQTGAEEYTKISLYGAILNVTGTSSSDGKTDKKFGMTGGENIWIGSRKVETQIAWSIKDGKGLHINHNNESLPTYYQFDMNGGTLSSVTLITSEGLIEVSKSKTDGEGVKLPEYYAGDLSKLTYSINNEDAELTISGIPNDLEDVTVSLVSGIENLASNATITGDKVALKAVPTAGKNYTLTISSSNYSDITRSVSTPITQEQKDILQKWVDKAYATEQVENDATLKEHVGEAEEMIDAESETSFNAATLIDELKPLVKAHFPTATVAATLKDSALAIELTGIELSGLENPTYQLTVPGHKKGQTTMIASGNLESLAFAIDAELTVGTEYTLTIVSDNYQDITTKVTAIKSIENATVSAIAAQTYTGKALAPAVTVKDGERTLVKDTDYTVSYKNNTNA
ncbi:hypothetical protein LI177_11090, partial [bacterium 210820-DFI.6.37]|nr:hypothetical protein [bacterium 210820-DFI.6.37]